MQTLRKFGVGRSIMQDRILEEVAHRFEVIDKRIDQNGGKYTLNPESLFNLLIGSIVNKILAGYGYSDNDNEFCHLKQNMDIMVDCLTPLDFILFSEYTYKLPFFKSRWAVVSQPQFEVLDMLKRQIDTRKAEISSGKHQLNMKTGGNDFIDAYLIEMKQREESGDDPGSLSEKFLAASLLDLWLAGTETTVCALLWAFIYLLNYPEVQNRVRQELLNVTNGNRPVELGDKSSLPYTSAVVTEVLRCANVLNFNLLHMTTCDTSVGDYTIPKGTAIVPQISVIMTDNSEFQDHLKFNPDRFLANENLEKQVVAFGVGKRACIGESLARAELFLIIANIIQRYKISVPEGCQMPSMEQVSLESVMKKARKYQIQMERVP
ncbi:hypothetical protein L596_026821 [Steinernema carpocapsae]|nr:hypothetical protein L596_026821 [Steinernema carpocapsae]